ncbi:MAG TPA: DUF2252 family protein [bacterium]|nr:DUF2252 family protein [bacterium]
MSVRRAALLLAAALLAAPACSSFSDLPLAPPHESVAADAHRADTIIDVITAADMPLIETRPADVAAKYAKMASDPFNFLRGNMALYEYDLAHHHKVWDVLPAATAILPNDPHPENLGTLGDASYLVVDWNDFDNSHVGPTGHDVLRGAVAVSVFARQVDPHGDSRDAALAFAKAYRDADPGVGGRFLDDLLQLAQTDGAAHQEIADELVTGTNGRMIKRGAKHLSVDAATRSAIASSLAAYEATRLAGAPALPPLTDVVQLKGKGVASLPLLRYELLFRGTAADGSEDILLQMKEAWDASAGTSTELNAWGVVTGMQTDDAASDLDPNLGVAHAGASWFVVRTVNAWQQGVDHKVITAAIANGTRTHADLVDLAAYLGGDLALAHLQGGADSTDLDASGLADLAESWADKTASDAATFAQRLASDGPLFGIQ